MNVASTVSVEKSQKILLGVSGGIAAYKCPELVRRLVERGATVQVVMTEAAASFVTPLSLQAVSGRPVRSALLDPRAEAGMDHIALARWADQILIAPATAHLIARLACGLADDLLTTLVLASTAPVTVAPAMNQQMWQHPATVANVETLRRRGYRLLGPAAGAQACGETGPGRMLEPADIADALLADAAAGTSAALAGRHVLLTAGPTREAIDPVRYVGNRSSGKMGYALAAALRRAGAEVTLVSGPTALPAPAGVTRIDVETAAEMHAAVMARARDAAIFVAAAAVADYRPAAPHPGKLKKHADTLTLELVRNPDILADVAALTADRPFTVGFAAETDDVEAHALAKLHNKGLDMIAANRVGSGVGFEADDNALLVFWHGGRHALPMMPKPALAEALTALIADRYAASTSG
ncbi:MAG: bifunctional phosphopantothenoylcysteine decarboxylase/phosphopantothenate--cysteine ligase CoaBC [Thiohalocapsa sp.]|uniref:bifunctional phosphopantothenoylcysteine decarboxylase/phosphopantothenate--cysteine ligase CoaBC n=1 Tax=Thiohalocapsa sp. TaxID=2497641 RepID=UPI0025EAEE36|nr:bifunctional phosphopantothenoylcysteine decarboxylase/phosphopantothenate--cysteine ligase CoaBC [Thiohalocapsa sp.]MCG6941890.1 bifunctional phosphopantothenoylcysteine decarboxylase/phosphopantothenate--cysteine ligase CoaBC [Thiohalocapsa sp.]